MKAVHVSLNFMYSSYSNGGPADDKLCECSFFKLIEKDLCKVQTLIGRCLKESENLLSPYIDHIKKSRGKMFRPALLLLTAKNFGKISQKHIITAAAIELIHQASLLHDDVIDGGQIRRNISTANKLYGNDAAILMGDFLLGKVVKICCCLDRNAVEKIADCAINTCRGEIMQISQRSNWNLTEKEYIKIIGEKSASLFAAVCSLGASLSGADHKSLDVFYRYGLNLGIAFQIKDDLMDITECRNKSGKTSGRDLEKKNITLPLLHLAKSLNKKDRIILNNLTTSRYALIKMMNKYGSIIYSIEKSKCFLMSAVKSIENIENKKIKAALIQAAQFAVNRSN